jgi:ABC-type lipoprotein release transport system permease subunit
MSTTVQSIDQGQVWLALETLRSLAGMDEEATLITLAKGTAFSEEITGWSYQSLDILLKDIHDLVRTKTLGATILYVILVLLAMLAIFDTQVLSIFRRRKEMGTLMAMGMTRLRIIQLFTLEGALHAALAALVAAVYGIPLLTLFARSGWAMPQAVDSYGFAIGERIFPAYSAGLVIGTTVLVMFVTTVVSFLPTRKIARLKPTDALRGRMS